MDSWSRSSTSGSTVCGSQPERVVLKCISALRTFSRASTGSRRVSVSVISALRVNKGAGREILPVKIAPGVNAGRHARRQQERKLQALGAVLIQRRELILLIPVVDNHLRSGA